MHIGTSIRSLWAHEPFLFSLMKTAAVAVLFLACLLGAPCACAEFYGFNFAAALKPVGERPIELIKSEWEGTWVGLHD
jgi:hypothetical protein